MRLPFMKNKEEPLVEDFVNAAYELYKTEQQRIRKKFVSLDKKLIEQYRKGRPTYSIKRDFSSMFYLYRFVDSYKIPLDPMTFCRNEQGDSMLGMDAMTATFDRNALERYAEYLQNFEFVFSPYETKVSEHPTYGAAVMAMKIDVEDRNRDSFPETFDANGNPM